MRNSRKHNIKSMTMFDKFDKTIFLRVQFAEVSASKEHSRKNSSQEQES